MDEAASEPRLMRRHREMLAVATVVTLTALLLQVDPEERVAFRCLPECPLPQTCASRAWFGIKCPGCGLTRSLVRLAAADWAGSWREHRLGWLMAASIL